MSSHLKQHRADSTSQITVRLLFFGAAREAVGCDEAEIEVHHPATAATVFAEILDAYPPLRLFNRSLLLAVNEEYARPETPVGNGDEIALFPPVSGGAEEAAAAQHKEDQDFFELTTEPLDIGEIARRAVMPNCGATVTLDGYVREFTRERERTLYLVYQAYPTMALSEMRRLGQQAHAQFDIAHIGIVHRIGRLEIGETSVVIAVSAPHRRAAFAACEWAITELKRTVPIWKKEFYEGGAVWSEGEGALKD